MDEKIDALNESGEPTGEVVWKSEAHRQGIWHRCFHCWVSGANASGPYLLVQRRAATKSTWPGRLDVSAAGHLGAGETPLDARRELEEELGLRVGPESLVPLGTRKIEQKISQGCDREFHEVFLLQDDTPPDNLRLQEEEVESVLALGLDEADALCNGETVAVEEWNGRRYVSAEVSAGNFVPNDDGYLSTIVQAARRLHAGKTPGGLNRT
ncbi:MAG: NUDIX domain-containing protein [Rubrobacteraceae bacterium]